MIVFKYHNKEGDTMICSDDITNLKADIGQKIGQKIIVKGTLGRNTQVKNQWKIW